MRLHAGMHLSPLSRYRASFLALAAALVLAGCSSDRPTEQPARAKRPPPPPLAGQEVFFNGAVLAEVKLGAGFAAADNGGDKGGSGAGGGRRHGGGGHRHGGGGGGGYGGGGGGYGGGTGGEGGDASSDAPRPARLPTGGPAVMIHIQITNHGTAPITVAAPDFDSILGNFVVFPEKLPIEPGQAAEFEPMTSRLGNDFAEVTVNLTLSVDGRSEQKAIKLLPTAPLAPSDNTTPAEAPKTGS